MPNRAIINLTITDHYVTRKGVTNGGFVVTISINNLTVSTKAGAGAVVGTLSQIDFSGTARQTNFTLDEDSAGFFGVSGNNLVTLRAAIPPAYYAVKVYGNAEYVSLSDDASFVLTVTAT